MLGSRRVSVGAGTLELEVPSTDGAGTVVVLKRVLLLPDLGDQAIISPGKLENEGVFFGLANPVGAQERSGNAVCRGSR